MFYNFCQKLFDLFNIETNTSHAGIPQVTKVDWGFPIKYLPRAKSHVGFHVDCPLPLPSKFLKKPSHIKFHETLFSVLDLLHADGQTRHGEAKRRIFLQPLAANTPQNGHFIQSSLFLRRECRCTTKCTSFYSCY